MAEHLFPLAERKEVAEGTMAFRFDTSGSDFAFEAGQNADFTLIDPPRTDAEGSVRTFSFTPPSTSPCPHRTAKIPRRRRRRKR